jgi:hypothetical protein
VKPIITTLKVALSALLATAFFAASAQACSYEKAENVFSSYGDPRAYVLVPGGDFASGGAGWTLEGGATAASGALSLPAGSSAVSPSICISKETPFVRSMARDSGVAGAKLKVEVLYEGLEAAQNRVVAGDKDEAWDPTHPLADNYRLRITAVGGDWEVDDVYVDPFARY